MQKGLIDMDDFGLCHSKKEFVLSTESGGVKNIGFSQQDVINHLSGKRQKKLEKRDAQLMLSYFKDYQLKNTGFCMHFKWM